ncbi:hypothetical protein HDU76_006522 [Blyttiomyces sp. JEL0837]|nr:hypothetical protein HDU76_006522 [Blyttiomyces sp. JEL0837]
MFFTTIVSLIASFTSLAAAVPVIERRDFTTQYPYGSSDVSIININPRTEEVFYYAGSELDKLSIDIQFAVKNKAFAKDVGIRYTNDSWTNVYEAAATYNSNLGGGYEMWNVTINRGTFWTSNPDYDRQYEVAAFVSYNKAAREWDPSNNYLVYNQANQQTPVRLASRKIQVDSTAQTVALVGNINAYAFDKTKDLAAGNVQVHWTPDNWKTTHDTAAVYVPANKTWSYNVVVGDAVSVPYNVFFAVKYTSSAGTFWDNNIYSPGSNYAAYLGATCEITNLPSKVTRSTGVITVNADCSTQTEISFGTAEFVIDGVAYAQVDGTYGKYSVNTTALTNGQHVAQYRLPYPSSKFYIAHAEISFTVDNTVA